MIYLSLLFLIVESSVADREFVDFDDVIDYNIYDCIFIVLIMIDYMYKIDL